MISLLYITLFIGKLARILQLNAMDCIHALQGIKRPEHIWRQSGQLIISNVTNESRLIKRSDLK